MKQGRHQKVNEKLNLMCGSHDTFKGDKIFLSCIETIK